MRIDRWLELKRTKALCIGLATLFAAEQAVWGADVNALHAMQISAEQERQFDAVRSAAVITIYDDLYGRSPSTKELKEALEFLKRSPQLAYLVERLSQSPEYRWKLRQLNPERIAQRKAEAARISEAVSRQVTDALSHQEFPRVEEQTIASIAAWLKQPETLCSNCAPSALAPMLGMVGIAASRETLTTQAFLIDYRSGHVNTFEGPLYLSMEAVQQVAAGYGLTLNPVELTHDELFLLRYPMIAALDLTQDSQADHYVVVQEANEARVVYYESDGTRESIPTHVFLKLFTGYALVASADSYGRVISQAQSRAITGGALRQRDEIPDLSPLFRNPSWKESAISLGLSFGLGALGGALGSGFSFGNAMTSFGTSQFYSSISSASTPIACSPV